VKALLARIERLEGRGPAPAPAQPSPRSPSQPATAAGRAAAPAPEAPQGGGTAVAVDGLVEMWPAVLERLEEDAPHLAAVLQSAKPSQVEDSELTIAWPESAGFFKRKAEDPASKEKIVRAIRAVTGASPRLAYELRDDDEIAPPAERLSEEELVQRFVEEFDAEEESA
jgi:DNA polymerase-3 subunit gamma/tau